MSSKLTDQVTATIEKAKADELARRQAAGQQLNELLRRNDEPKKGDDQQLLDAMKILGLRADDLPGVLELVTEIHANECLLVHADEAHNELRASIRKLSELDALEAEERRQLEESISARRQPFETKKRSAEAIVNRQAPEARRQLSLLHPRWKALVDGTSVDEAREALSPKRGTPHGQKWFSVDRNEDMPVT